MKSVSEEIWRKWVEQVQPLASTPAPVQPSGVVGQLTSSGRAGAIEEYIEPRTGEVIARRVSACGASEHWLRSDQLLIIRNPT